MGYKSNNKPNDEDFEGDSLFCEEDEEMMGEEEDYSNYLSDESDHESYVRSLNPNLAMKEVLQRAPLKIYMNGTKTTKITTQKLVVYKESSSLKAVIKFIKSKYLDTIGKRLKMEIKRYLKNSSRNDIILKIHSSFKFIDEYDLKVKERLYAEKKIGYEKKRIPKKKKEKHEPKEMQKLKVKKPIRKEFATSMVFSKINDIIKSKRRDPATAIKNDGKLKETERKPNPRWKQAKSSTPSPKKKNEPSPRKSPEKNSKGRNKK